MTHDPNGMSMSLQRNRMHAVLGKMGHHLEQRLGRRIFKIDTLLADPFHAAHVFAGGVDETRHAAHIDAYRHRFAFHPIHGILATHPLKRLRHVGRVIVAGAREAHVPRHLGWETAATVEEAVAGARAAHRPAVTIAVVEQPGMPADPDRAPRR